MFLKWIVCEVENDQKQAFSHAQERWRKIVSAKGFIAQAGGWDADMPDIACVIGLWENERDLSIFMNSLHDEIFRENNQADTYKSININYFLSGIEMQGECISMSEAIRKGGFLRIADCIVKPDRAEHFEEVQKEIWMPGMKNSKGMLGGLFSKNTNSDSRYLVSTFWDNEINHSNYIKTKLPVFQKGTDIKSDLKNITGRKIRLVSSWKVVRLKDSL